MRIIGIRHRVKKTADGEARPTQVAIREDGAVQTFDLETESNEYDFMRGKFPIKYRNAEKGEDTKKFESHHIRLTKLRKNESPETVEGEVVNVKKVNYKVEVPSEYEGLQSGDRVAMTLGGSGDNFALAMANRGRKIAATVHRIPPAVFKEVRGDNDVNYDAALLTGYLNTNPEMFYEIGPRERSLIALREKFRARVDAMKARIACEQRLRQYTIGSVFCSPEGEFPEGDIEKQFDKAKANDKIYRALVEEENKRNIELKSTCELLDVYTQLFKPIVGLGPMIASRIIGAVIDIRRFKTKAKLRAFCGVHLLKDGRFPRRRNNEVANWNGYCRQALYLLGDQFNRRPDSEWGKKLIKAKLKYRTSHPYPVLVTKDGDKYELREGEYTKSRNGYTITLYEGGESRQVAGLKGTLRYTDGHIHKMAIWYTLGKFVEQLFKDWWNLQKGIAKPVPIQPTETGSQSEGVVEEFESPEEAAA